MNPLPLYQPGKKTDALLKISAAANSHNILALVTHQLGALPKASLLNQTHTISTCPTYGILQTAPLPKSRIGSRVKLAVMSR